jgi:hypothetical protein
VPELLCKVCKNLLDRAVIAMAANAHAIARFSQAVCAEREADFKALEEEVNATRIEREQAKEQYELHVATHQRAMTSGASQ